MLTADPATTNPTGRHWGRWVMASALLLVAVTMTVALWGVGLMMSVDKEWTGWGDILLNHYIMVPYGAALGVCVLAAGLVLEWFSPAMKRIAIVAITIGCLLVTLVVALA